jgi:hypothetical protein
MLKQHMRRWCVLYVGGALFLLLSFPDSIGDFRKLESDISAEHSELVVYRGRRPALVVVSVLYWELEGYEVKSCPALKKVIAGCN